MLQREESGTAGVQLKTNTLTMPLKMTDGPLGNTGARDAQLTVGDDGELMNKWERERAMLGPNMVPTLCLVGSGTRGFQERPLFLPLGHLNSENRHWETH
jgi:hypothetical protein